MSFTPLTRREFDTLLAPLVPALYRIARRYVPRDTAPDAVGDGLVTAWLAIARYDPSNGQAGLLRHLYIHVRDSARDRQRRDNRRSEILLPPDEILKRASWGCAPPMDSDAYAAMREELLALMPSAGLSDRQKECFTLYLSGKTEEQIAACLEVSQATVSRHISAAADKLRTARSWNIEVDPRIETFFWECVRQVEASIYYAPSSAPNKHTTAESRHRRRYRVGTGEERVGEALRCP